MRYQDTSRDLEKLFLCVLFQRQAEVDAFRPFSLPQRLSQNSMDWLAEQLEVTWRIGNCLAELAEKRNSLTSTLLTRRTALSSNDTTEIFFDGP